MGKISLLNIGLAIGFCFFTGCGGGGSSSSNSSSNSSESFSTGGGSLAKDAIDNFVNSFVILKIKNLDASSKVLVSSIGDLNSTRTDTALSIAKTHWIESRDPWERIEAAPFGPFDIYGIDPSIDTWPLNATDLQKVLASDQKFTQEMISSLDNSLKGFHAIEYILFGDDAEKSVEEITEREYEFLVALAKDFDLRVTIFRDAWISGYAGQRAYAREVVTAGQGSTVFARENDVLEQIAQGIIAACDEVAEGKIEDPFSARNPDLVESQFSKNTLADFSSNIEGSFESYQISLSDMVKQSNEILDQNIRASFNAAISGLRNLPNPFPDAIQNPANDKAIINVQNQIRASRNLIENGVLPITRAQ